MKCKLSTSTLFVCSLIFLTACDNENGPQVSSTYEFHSIQWKLNEGESLETFEELLPETVILNRENTDIPILYTTKDLVEESSYFYCEHTDLLNKWTEDLLVTIPTNTYFLSEEYSSFIGEPKAPLYAGEKIILEPSSYATMTSDLTPLTKVTFGGTVHYRKLSASYCARFVGEEYQDVLEFQGTWTGVFIDKTDHWVLYEPLEE
ncbi:MAG: hypothetical protein LIP08_04595 [Bacteroides sp.]|nr:hypothetical protein [Bacteroides sp.]